MILAIDAGNTRIKWGVHDGRRFTATGAMPTADAAAIGDAWADAPRAERGIASNVAGPTVRDALQAACTRHGIPLQVIRSSPSQCGVRNGYADPAQLGTDRWAALVGAHAAETGHKLVVNVGTALTVDALAADGRFLGGLIVPGPALMRRSLDRGTADLRHTEGHFHDFPRATADAITSGALQACIGAVDRMAGAMAEQSLAIARVVLSGGGASEIAPHLPFPLALRENLVLEGLVLLARES
jgi:type III pantothenate kinase